MLKIGKPSERNRSTFDTIAKIPRELKEPTGSKSILSNCNVSFEQSMCRLGFVKSSDFSLRDAVIAEAIEYHEDMYFENRKRRPQERGRKKRRKGKWNPIDRLWNSASSKRCSSWQFLEQD
jgi:hypothetical protein